MLNYLNKFNSIIIISLLLLTGAFLYKIQKANATVIIQNTDQVYEYGEPINLSSDSFIKEIIIKNNLKDVSQKEIKDRIKLNLNIENEKGKDYAKVGEYTGSLEIKDGDNSKNSFQDYQTKLPVRVTVKDTIKPDVILNKKEVSFDYGQKINNKDIDKYINIKDLSSTSIKYDLEKVNTSKSGKYTLDIVVSDEYKNESKSSLNIIVKEKPKPKTKPSSVSSKKPTNNTSNKSYSSYISPYFHKDGNKVTGWDLKNADKEISFIPYKVRNFLMNSNWNYYISSKNIGANYFPDFSGKGKVIAVTIAKKRKVYISHKHIEKSTLHEFGHVYDSLLGYPSDGADFKEIFKQERYKFVDYYKSPGNHHTNSTDEYFASTFMSYCRYPKVLKTNTPKTYNFFVNLEKSIR